MLGVESTGSTTNNIPHALAEGIPILAVVAINTPLIYRSPLNRDIKKKSSSMEYDIRDR